MKEMTEQEIIKRKELLRLQKVYVDIKMIVEDIERELAYKGWEGDKAAGRGDRYIYEECED